MTFDPNKHQNRVALTLSANHVLSVGFGSYCDQDSFHGWLMRFDVSTSPITRLVPFVTTPNTSRGALWQGGNGFADDGTGAIYFLGANGPLTPATRDTSGTSLGNAFAKITGTTSTTAAPSIASWFMPSTVGTLDDGDLDIGSSGPLLIPGTSLIAGGGKGGLLYLINKDTMGGFNAAGDTKAVQELQVAPGGKFGQIVGSPIFWNRGTAGQSTMYLWPGMVPLKQFTFNATTGFTQAFQSTVNPTQDVQGGNLSLSANGTTSGTGIVWATHSLSSAGGGGGAVPGLLYAFNADNVTSELWDSNKVTGDALASYAKYTVPTVVNGKVYVSTFSNEVDVYGLFATPVDGGVRDAGAPKDAGPVLLTCATVDGGAAQPTTWSYVYSTYFAGNNTPDGGAITLGHCAECHAPGGRGSSFFLSGRDKDTFYQGLVAVHQLNPDAGASSAFGAPSTSPLAWFGERSNGLGLMPQDVQAQDIPNPRAIAAVCGWIKAGAINDVVCPSGQAACNNVCFDLTSSNAHCGSCAVSCATGTTCLASICCATGSVNCSGACVTTASDVNNCGGCAIKCAAPTGGSASCTASVCKAVCPTGTSLCGSACVATASDVNNCGGCAIKCAAPTGGSASCTASVCKAVCPTGTSLCGSACVATASDVNNCGGCATKCAPPAGGTTACSGAPASQPARRGPACAAALASPRRAT